MEKLKVIEQSSGTKEYWFGEKRHREDGPAIEWATGISHWYQDDKLHNFSGPAVVTPHRTELWFVNGEQKTKEVKNWFADNQIDDWTKLDDGDFSIMWFEIFSKRT
jgi:hypothetical protein